MASNCHLGHRNGGFLAIEEEGCLFTPFTKVSQIYFISLPHFLILSLDGGSITVAPQDTIKSVQSLCNEEQVLLNPTNFTTQLAKHAR